MSFLWRVFFLSTRIVSLIAVEADFDDLLASLEKTAFVFEARKEQAASLPDRWRDLYKRAPDSVIEDGALLLSEWGTGEDPEEARQVFDTLADEVSGKLLKVWAEASLGAQSLAFKYPSFEQANAVVSLLNAHLFGDFGLAGNRADYYDPANSFISEVLRQRQGIPISLGVVWVAVARRLGLSASILARFPQHVLVRVSVGDGDPKQDIYVDSFAGTSFTWEGLRAFAVRHRLPDDPEYLLEFVEHTDAPEVHARMLRNLRHIYEGRGEDARLLLVLDQALAVSSAEKEELAQLRVETDARFRGASAPSRAAEGGETTVISL